MTTIVNGRLLWQWNNAEIMTWNADFSFNWYNLANGTTVRVLNHNADDWWAVDFETFKYAQQDWGWVLWRYFRTQTINIVLSIREDTPELLSALMDEIKFQCYKIEWALRIKSFWVVREWQATCTEVKFNRKWYNVNWLWDVHLVFKATNPHAHAIKPISLNVTSQTWQYKSSLSYIWRAPSFMTLNMLIETWWTYVLSYKLNGFTISLASHTYTAWDIVKLDWVSKKATINDVEVEYTWSFRPLNYWDNPIEINYTWTYTATLSYYENYL